MPQAWESQVGEILVTKIPRPKAIKKYSCIRCPDCNEVCYSIEIQRKIDGIMMAFHEGRLLAQPFAAVRLT
jgi:ferredoxin